MVVDVISYTETDSCSLSGPVTTDAGRTSAELSFKSYYTCRQTGTS